MVIMPISTEAAVLLGSRTEEELLESRLSYLPLAGHNVKSSHYCVYVWLRGRGGHKGATQNRPSVLLKKTNKTPPQYL